VESDPDVDPVHRLPEEERPEGHREVGRHPHHFLPLLRSLWLRPSLRLSAADWGILATAAASSGQEEVLLHWTAGIPFGLRGVIWAGPFVPYWA
jgi:hypothetical protein